MLHFETTYYEVLTVYDILRPVYYCCFPIGLLPFSINEKKFKSCTWILFWNTIIFITFVALGLWWLLFRMNQKGALLFMYMVAYVVRGWLSIINITIIIIFGSIYKNRVS